MHCVCILAVHEIYTLRTSGASLIPENYSWSAWFYQRLTSSELLMPAENCSVLLLGAIPYCIIAPCVIRPMLVLAFPCLHWVGHKPAIAFMSDCCNCCGTDTTPDSSHAISECEQHCRICSTPLTRELALCCSLTACARHFPSRKASREASIYMTRYRASSGKYAACYPRANSFNRLYQSQDPAGHRSRCHSPPS